MDKAVLKKFAIESRQDLMSKIKNKINTYYVDEEFAKEQKGDLYILSNSKHSLSLTNEEYKKRELLIKRIKELSFEQVIEEAAYTWFNRIIAIRYMEINDMLPLTRDNQSLGIRVLSSKDNTPDPEILKFTNLMNPELDIEFKKEKYAEFKDDNEKFKYVLLLVCKKLGRVIPQVFDGITDYIDILVPDNLLNDTGFISKIIYEVPEENYNQVEILGWLYQYYNQSEKDKAMKKNTSYNKNEIPYVTQLFTPDWIVKYMVENTLGKYWIENSNQSTNCEWKYLIKENINKNTEILSPKNITFLDPCCGSGHILVYAFEVLFKIYLQSGFNKNEIAENILKYNLYGIDIDDRAGQLAILAVLLKAREYDKNIFNKDVVRNLNIISIQESNSISENIIDYIDNIEDKDLTRYLIDNFKNAKEIGSLLLLEKKDYSSLLETINKDNTIFSYELKQKILPLIKSAGILTKKFNIVVTNPPYINNMAMSSNLKQYVIEKYEEYKYDLFSSFIVRNTFFSQKDSYLGFMTPNVWMFLKTYENLRKMIITEKNIISLIQLAKGSFFKEATVDICSFILKNNRDTNVGTYVRLEDFKGDMDLQEKKYLEAINSESCNYVYNFNNEQLSQVPGYRIAYWISNNTLNTFNNDVIEKYAKPRQGMATSDNNKFLRLWFEIDYNKICFNAKNSEEALKSGKKWFPYNKGGSFRKWYGNNSYVINWENDGAEVKELACKLYKCVTRTIKNIQYYFKKGITWSTLSSGAFSARYCDDGFLFDTKGSTCFFDNEDYIFYCNAFLNSKVVDSLLEVLAPTLDYNAGSIAMLPLSFDKTRKDEIDTLVKKCITLCKEDWDNYEFSWDFQCNPLVKIARKNKLKKIEDSYKLWNEECNERFKSLKETEEELNRIFIKIYGLENDINEYIDEKYISVTKADKKREIESLITYSVGCMLGRYSLDDDGLVFAGGTFDKNKYQTYEVDEDNIILLTEKPILNDDIVEKFKKFIITVYGEDTLVANLNYIAEILGKKGTETSEEAIRRYFINEFFDSYASKCSVTGSGKRPIYWLFDSGKKNGFKALVYMHRYNENLIPKVRLDYLHRIQTTYEKLLSDVNYKLTTELSMSDKKSLQNQQADLNAKLQEIKEYDEKIAHIANQRISIDLDDGVKENYDKFKDILAKIK